MAWAINPYESFITVLQWTISAMALLIVANIINKDHLLKALLFSAVLVSIAGIIHLTISPDAWREIPSIMFANAHQASFYVLMCLSIAFYFSGWYLLGVIPIGTFLVLENSETVIVALCVMGICTLIYYVRFQSPQVLIMGCVFVFMALVMVAPSTKTDTLSEKDTSINIDQFKIGSRKALYQRALSMVRDFPQGIGINNLKIHYPLYLKGEKRWETTPKTQTTYVHNDYLQLLIEAGIAGFLLFVLAVFAGICSLDWKNRRTPFVFVSILSLWVISSAQFSMYQAWAPFLLFCFLGVGQCEE